MCLLFYSHLFKKTIFFLKSSLFSFSNIGTRERKFFVFFLLLQMHPKPWFIHSPFFPPTRHPQQNCLLKWKPYSERKMRKSKLCYQFFSSLQKENCNSLVRKEMDFLGQTWVTDTDIKIFEMLVPLFNFVLIISLSLLSARRCIPPLLFKNTTKLVGSIVHFETHKENLFFRALKDAAVLQKSFIWNSFWL